MPAPATYDPKLVVIHFRGRLISGYAPDTFISIAMNADDFTLDIGAGGEGARTRSNNQSATIKLTLMQTSASNDWLSTSRDMDRLAGGGIGIFQMKDMTGRALANAPFAWVKKRPDMERGASLTNPEWTLETDSMQMFVGGN